MHLDRKIVAEPPVLIVAEEGSAGVGVVGRCVRCGRGALSVTVGRLNPLEGKGDATGVGESVEGEGAATLEPGNEAAACVGVAEVEISVGDTEGGTGQGQAPIRFPPLLKDHSIAAETVGSGCTI